MARIDIIALGEDAFYSVGAIEVNNKGEVYLITKFKEGTLKTSRHVSGKTHWKMTKRNDGEKLLYKKLRDGSPLRNFKGLEYLGTQAFGLDSLPQLHDKYMMSKYDGLFAFDMRKYKNHSFNMSVWILTKEGFSDLYKIWEGSKNRQIYLYTDSHPMIAIVIMDFRK